MMRITTPVLEAAPALPATKLPRRIFYGWYILPIAILGVVATSPGQTYGIAAFNESFRSDLQLSHSQLTAAYMLGTFLAALPLSWIGLMMDRHGIRRVKALVVVGIGFACIIAAFANELFSLFVAFFLLRMLGPGALSLLSGSTLGFWFDRRLGMVEGIRHLGMAFSVAVIPGVNLWLIATVGWRAAFALLGVATCALMLPLLATVFRNRPEEVGQQRDGGPSPHDPFPRHTDSGDDVSFADALRSRAFWIVLAINALWGLVATAVTFNIIPIVQTQGLQATSAAGLLAIFAITLALTHVIGGILADHMPIRSLLAFSAVCMALCTASMMVLAWPGMLAFCGITMGLAQGLSTGLTSVVCVRFFGRLHVGRIRGVYSSVQIAASSIGPFAVGLTRDLSGEYSPALVAFTLAALLASMAACFATPPRRSQIYGHPQTPSLH
jgi:MFS family permease